MLKVKPEGALEQRNQSLHQKNQWEKPSTNIVGEVTQTRQEAAIVNQWPGLKSSDKFLPAARMTLRAGNKLYDQIDRIKMLG